MNDHDREFTHKICAIEMRKRPGRRVCLCGEVRQGPLSPLAGRTPCLICQERVLDHYDNCDECQDAHYFTADRAARERDQRRTLL